MSAAVLDRAFRTIPGGSSTNAKSPLRSILPEAPFAVSANGCTFVDTTGRSWLDIDMAVGAVVWGHAHAAINAAVMEQLPLGMNYSVPSVRESAVAERILDRLGSFDCLRFCKTGSDAVSAAVRLARATTGRNVVVCGSYHGWHDWSAYRHYGAAPSLGVPSAVGALTEPLTSATARGVDASFERARGVAAVVVCPEEWDSGELHAVRDICSKRGVILIFDEVKSGLRVGRRGAGAEAGIVPDLVCISKGLANGFPLAALIGKRQLMADITGTRFTGTYFGEVISLAAADASEALLRKCEMWPSWRGAAEAVMQRTRTAIAGIRNDLEVTGYAGCFRVGTRGTAAPDDPFRRHFVLTLAQRGIFSSGWVLFCDAHRENDLARVTEAILDAVATWRGDDSTP